MTQNSSGESSRPVIGVIPLWDEKKDSLWMLPGYMQGLQEAGALAVMLPLTDSEGVLGEAARLCDGFLFTGGHDVDPQVYGEEKSPRCGAPCTARDRMESFLFRAAVLGEGKPALGICRGIQLFNALLGGTLYQDIPSELSTRITHVQGAPYDVPAHGVRIAPGSPLADLLGTDSLQVNSYHHQGIKRLAPGLEPMAAAEDGLVEAVYMPGKPFVWAVQWHPEFALQWESSGKLFSALVRACSA
ncbi:MAG: gamma-glutamyl-gamma-aminobutyrate hydrolase family protein [Spirochaetaceae bacterium]|jgi:putative glutamine amidotransferase|nr:gamma-glutamyl-gamma-aminobutyrate hydrolase family protein [Spirochaetaceae bacterium]